MKTSNLALLIALPLVLLQLGCDAGKKPYEQAAALEAQGKWKEAAQAYEAVCTVAAASKLCSPARVRASRARWSWAVGALYDGKEAELREALEALSKDTLLATSSAAIVSHPEAKAAQAWAEAAQTVDPQHKNQKLEAIANEPVSFAPKAREMVKAKPEALLQTVKDACKAGGAGSCSAAAERLDTAFPDSPQAKEAASLARDELVRLYPVLDKLEKLLIQRLETYNAWATKALCAEEVQHPLCGDMPDGVDEKVLNAAFTKQLQELPDSVLKERFEQRWKKVAATGELDAEAWPKPPKK